MKVYIVPIMLTLCLFFPSGIKAQGDYVLSAGDTIQVFIYQYHPAKKEAGKFARPSTALRKLKSRAFMEPLKVGARVREKMADEGRKLLGLRKGKELYLKKKGISAKEAMEEERKGIIIRPDGRITVPLIGEIEAAGKTIPELDRIITEKLKSFIPHPEVTVMLISMASRKDKVYVLGEVERPGLYPVRGEMSLLKALTMAGSPTKAASLSTIYLYRNNSHGQEIIPLRAKGLIDKLDLSGNVRIYPEDIIYIPRSKIVTLNDYIGYYITPLEFMVLLLNLKNVGHHLDIIYGLALGLTYGYKWVFFDESPALTTSSINVPLDSWVYLSLDDLTAKDLITTRPLTRNEVGLLIKEAGEDRDSLEECERIALQKLEREFGSAKQASEGGAGGEKKIYGYVRTGLFYLDSHDHKEYFDYQRDHNWFGHGFNPRTEISLGGDLWPKLSYNFTGSLWHNGDKIKEDIKESYLKLNFKNLEIEVGRDHIWWGPCYHGNLLFSDNPPPFDLVKLTTRTDKFKFGTFLTRLEEERPIPKPYLNGMRFEWLPFDNFTLGGSRAIMFMGEGRPSLKIGDIPTILGGENVGGRLETNQLAGLDFAWRFKKLELYGAWAGEDEAQGLPSGEGYQLGTYLKDFFNKALNLRIEYALNRKKPHQQVTWYEHHLYKSGYTYKGQIIGHHMGGDSQDIFMRLGYRLTPQLTSAFELDYERHGMIKPVEERKTKYALELGYDLTPTSSIFIRHENRRTQNNNFVEGGNRRDSYTRLEWEYRF